MIYICKSNFFFFLALELHDADCNISFINYYYDAIVIGMGSQSYFRHPVSLSSIKRQKLHQHVYMQRVANYILSVQSLFPTTVNGFFFSNPSANIFYLFGTVTPCRITLQTILHIMIGCDLK